MGDMPPKRTPGAIWKQIVDEARDDEEIEKIASMSPAQLDKELKDAGFDLDDVRADADAFRQKLERSVAERRAKQLEAQARVRSLRPQPRRRPVVVWLAAATVGAVGVGGIVYALTHPGAPPAPSPPGPSSVPVHEPSPADLIAASDLRQRAYDDCAAQRWTECLAGLEGAKKLDPAGDRSSEVQLARQQAEHQLAVDGGPEGDKPHPR
jgi:hypothetical protein